ncbi:MAG: flippase-like domain-containing protein [Elusimicrobia bacterium]|nr:flippase-like domain-containing protein [Elusimicrobiota bacterium]
MTRRRLLAAGGLACTGFFLWLALRKVRFALLTHILAGARWGWLVPMAAIVFLDLLIRALRWRVLLSRAIRDAPVLELLRLEAIGLAVNNVLFLRIGELARGLLAARRLQIPTLAALASVVVERALDVAALLALFVAAAAGAPGFVPLHVRQGAELVLTGALAALAFLSVAEGWVAGGGWIERLLRPWPQMHRLLEQLALGAAVLRQPAAAAQAAFWSLVLWIIDAALYWAGAQAFGLGGVMSWSRSVLTLSWAAASSALPAAPGALGTFEAFVQDIVTKFGASPERAFAYALVSHMLMFLLVTVTGLIFLYRVGLSLADLRGQVEKR